MPHARHLPLFFILYGLLGLILGLINEDFIINYIAIGTIFFILCLYSLKKYSLLWFFIFIYLIYLTPYLVIYLSQGDFSSWRQGGISLIENNRTLAQLAALLAFGSILVGLKLTYFRKDRLPSPTQINQKSTLWSWRAKAVMYAMGILPLLIFSALLSGRNRDTWLEDSGAGDISAINIAFMMIYLSAAYFATRWMNGKSWRIGILFPSLSSLLFAYAGFRYCLVGIALIFATAYMQKNKVSLKKAIAFLFLAFLAYSLMTIIAISRNLDTTPFEVATKLISGQLDKLTFLSAAGAHEQNIYYSYVRTLENQEIYYGSLYLDVFIRTLPSFIYANLFDTTRVNDLISAIAAPISIFDTKLNLGAFFLAEAHLNFGLTGVIIIYSASIFLIDSIESIQQKSLTAKIMYFVSIANLPNYIYYGSNSIVKIAFYSLITILLIRIISTPHRIRGSALQ